MKKIPLSALLFFLAGTFAFSQNAGYPGIMNNGTFLLNGGIGFGDALDSEMKMPPLILSGDFAIPFFALPFTAGLAAAVSTEEGSEKGIAKSSTNLGFSFRLAYHIDWNLKNFDSYALVELGDILAWESISAAADPSKNKTDALRNVFWYGFGAGARYFFLPGLGAYAELTISNFCFFTFGVCTRL